MSTGNRSKRLGRLLNDLRRRNAAIARIDKSQLHEREFPPFSVMEHNDNEGNLIYLSAYGHFQWEEFISECFRQCYARPVKVTNRWIVMKRVQPRNEKARGYYRTIFCNEQDYGAQPITVGEM